MTMKSAYWCPSKKGCGKSVYYSGNYRLGKYECLRCKKLFKKEELTEINTLRKMTKN